MKTRKVSLNYVVLDPVVVRELCNVRGWSQSEVERRTELTFRTVEKLYKGDRVHIDSAWSFAKAVGLESLSSLLLRDGAKAPEDSSLRDWDRVGCPTTWITASNALQWRSVQLRHKHMANKVARGKCYELSNLTGKERKELQHQFVRHPEVCWSLQPHPRFPLCFGTFPERDAWWVVDEWVPGKSVAQALANGGLDVPAQKKLLREIAEGLQALHRKDIVWRELSPAHVILRESDGSAVLNDFELGKLLAGSPTVSKDWPADPYRAPEVGADGVDKRADVYSWARLFVHVTTGQLLDTGAEKQIVKDLKLPSDLFNVVCNALSPRRSQRPADMGAVLDALAIWN